MYTVKQVSEMAQVSVRTLHYYDEIGLLHPAKVGENSYRYYDDAALLRLQQILFYREIGLELMQIKDMLDSPHFDLVTALYSHRNVLIEKIERLEDLVQTVDDTINHLTGEKTMSKVKLFKGFSSEKQKQYEREVRLQYGPDIVNESVKRWESYTQAQKDQMAAEGNAIYEDIMKAIEEGVSPTDSRVQDILVRWHNHLRWFYEPTLEILRGLGEMYNSHPDFIKNFQKIHPDLPQYLQDGITQYVDDLEYAEIERMLAEDEQLKSNR
jgi:MerR family transcriptional regulator, thiopeptide resistance regulator